LSVLEPSEPSILTPLRFELVIEPRITWQAEAETDAMTRPWLMALRAVADAVNADFFLKLSAALPLLTRQGYYDFDVPQIAFARGSGASRDGVPRMGARVGVEVSQSALRDHRQELARGEQGDDAPAWVPEHATALLLQAGVASNVRQYVLEQPGDETPLGRTSTRHEPE
jgi:hypothetical protein